MNAFSSDVDLLRYEPTVFTGSGFPGQVLCKGTNGQVSGTTFTAADEDFLGKQIRAGHVIYLSDGAGNIEGAYEVVSVDSATQLTISVLRAEASAPLISIGAGSSLFYRIGTFDAQGYEVMTALAQNLAIRPGRADSPYSIDDIADPQPLRSLSALMVLQLVFGSLYQNAETDAVCLVKKDLYERLAEQARQRCVIQIDVGDDEIYEKTLAGAHAKLVRE